MGEKEIVPLEYRFPLILVGISIITLGFAVTLLMKTTQYSDPIQFSSDEKVSSESSRTLIVDVSGAIAKPGVYTLPIGSRVVDAITIAGGFTVQADMERVAATLNQASILSDGAKVYIPVKGNTNQEQNIAPSIVSVKTISINTANTDELETLSGVGPVTAKKIIDNRPYITLDDLVTKKILSASLFDKLKNQLTL